MKFLKLNTLSSTLLITAGTLLIQPVSAAEWSFADSISQGRQTQISQYYYVAQGESWNSVTYHAHYNADKNVQIVVNYDDKPIYRATLSGPGTLSFAVPASKSGFHRLDFMVRQNNSINSSNLCVEEYQLTAFEQARLSYESARKSYRLSDLPDALYNPKLSSPTSLKAAFVFNSKNIAESSMLTRLLSSWEQSRPIEWLDAQQAVTEQPDFSIIIQHKAQLSHASLLLSAPQNVPTLLIQYSTAKQLENAVDALLNPQYLQQLTAESAVLPDNMTRPVWAVAKSFNNLADLGIQDFRLGKNQQAFTLNFPAVWQPTDILQGQIALRSQSGLLEGSAITAWVNSALAGSMKLANLESDPVDRQFNIFGADIAASPVFNLDIENTVIANSKCLPNVQSAVWINTEKSTVNLPFKLKQGVISLSSALAANHNIAINDHPNSSSMAASAMQTAKKMLMTAAPVPLNLTHFDPARPQMVNIRVNADIYQQQVKMHQDILYAPTAAHGFFVIYQNEKFNLITDDKNGADTFNRLWPTIQDQIPNNTAKLFVSSEGRVYVLKKLILKRTDAPLIEQSNIFSIIIVLVSALAALLLFVWLWRKRKNESQNE